MNSEAPFDTPDAVRRFLRGLKPDDDPAGRRAVVVEVLCGPEVGLDGGSLSVLLPQNLERIYLLYEELLFRGALGRLLRAGGHTLAFDFNRRLTRTGGRLVTVRRPDLPFHFRLEVSSHIIAKSFSDAMPGPFQINGLRAENRIEAVILILEHEIVHLAEYLLYGDSNCSRGRFRRLIYDWFGHTDVTHRLATAGAELAGRGLRIGSLVEFDFRGEVLRGRINRVTKRATVLVPSTPEKGCRYSDGRHYQKLLVPIPLLRPVED